MERDFDFIATAACDSCGERRPGVMMHSHGTPVLFLCNRPGCGGHLRFEGVARRDIDEWLDKTSIFDVEELRQAS